MITRRKSKELADRKRKLKTMITPDCGDIKEVEAESEYGNTTAAVDADDEVNDNNATTMLTAMPVSKKRRLNNTSSATSASTSPSTSLTATTTATPPSIHTIPNIAAETEEKEQSPRLSSSAPPADDDDDDDDDRSGRTTKVAAKRKRKQKQKQKATTIVADPRELEKEEQFNKEMTRMKRMHKELVGNGGGGYRCVIGVDEAGRGPLAGPVVVGACYVPLHVRIPGIADSKKITEEQRERLYELIVAHPEIEYGVAILDHHVIDDLNILGATLKGMRDSAAELNQKLKRINEYKTTTAAAAAAAAAAATDAATSHSNNNSNFNSNSNSMTDETETIGFGLSSASAIKRNQSIGDTQDEEEENNPALANANTSTDSDNNADADAVTVAAVAVATNTCGDNSNGNADAGGGADVVDMILVDGNRDPLFVDPPNVDCRTIVKGDANVYCIAAASIIAKVTRDRLMYEFAKLYPIYEFATNKGYPTPKHKRTVLAHGPCPIHRQTFRPVIDWLRDHEPETFAKLDAIKQQKIADKKAVAKLKRQLAKEQKLKQKMLKNKTKIATKTKSKPKKTQTASLLQYSFTVNAADNA